ncbi:unnamed protein product, partial [Cladocopium goreaui]
SFFHQMRWLHRALVSGLLNALILRSESLEDLSGDGGVLKRCLRTGTGSTLPEGESGSVVRATVRGPIAVSPSGEVLDDPGITEIILGQGQISSGLDMAIGSMREKEEALIRLSASYAPKNRISEDVTDVTFQLELLKFDLVDASSLHRGAQQAIEDLEETPSNGGDADKTVMLGGVPVKMDHLGPVILNDDGSMRRIANWREMTEHERQVALRRIGQRNQRRLAKLTADL